MFGLTLYFALGAYLLGGIPFGKIIARIVAQIDITQRGSRNIGATNVARELGLKWGLLTLTLDILKGLVPILLFSTSTAGSGLSGDIALALVSLCPLLGHQFSIFMGLKGGKGVATALGAYLALSPISCLLGLSVFVLVVVKWHYVSLGSMISAGSVPIFLALLHQPMPLVLASVVMAILIYLKHAENISRLARGEEKSWKHRKSPASS